MTEESLLDHAMHQKIGIAPDGTGEMTIGIECKTIMQAVLRGVDRPFHGAQQQRGNEFMKLLIAGIGQNLLKRLRITIAKRSLIDTFEKVEFLHYPIQREERLRVGRIMDAVDTGHRLGTQPFRHDMIGENHRFFDNTCCLGAFAVIHSQHRPLVVETNLRLHAIEIHTSRTITPLEKLFGNAAQSRKFLL